MHLHWANKDQYYVKTAEHFRNYGFKCGGVSTRFSVTNANIEQDNVKGEKRYFFPRYREIAWDRVASTVEIPFDFRPMTAKEQREIGKNHVQESIVAQAVSKIPNRLSKAERAVAALLTERHRSSDNERVSYLEYHLRQYTRRNTSDFFIHKDLKGFLEKELDFFLKNEVLNIDGFEQGRADQAEGLFQVFRVVKLAGEKLIAFFAQVEDFQKKLWEKRKFITDVQYCISVSVIDESMHPAIATCDAQWVEWAELLATKVAEHADRIAFLKAHPSLTIDTKHFSEQFVDDLLASLPDSIEDLQDGLVVHSDNYQALCLLSGRYRGEVQSIYIDPPYNTDASAILYKNVNIHEGRPREGVPSDVERRRLGERGRSSSGQAGRALARLG